MHSAENEVKMEDLSRRKRWERVIGQGLCRLCLVKHPKKECKSTSVCGKNGCQAKHHPLLHNDAKDEANRTNANAVVRTSTNNNRNVNNIHRANVKPLLLGIVPVIVYGKNKAVKILALLDEGSTLTMMDESVVRDLQISGTPDPLCLKWMADTVRQERALNEYRLI